MENEILLEILKRLGGIEIQIGEIRADITGIHQEINAIREDNLSIHQEINAIREDNLSIHQEINTIHQEIDDMRASHAVFEINVMQELGAMRDAHAIVMDYIKENQIVSQKAKSDLDESVSARVAFEATLMSHEERITALECAG